MPETGPRVVGTARNMAAPGAAAATPAGIQMRDNLIRMCDALARAAACAMSPLPTLCLHQLADGARATVARVVSASAEIDAVALRRLGELGFLPGEPVQLLRRGPGGREPLAVLIGETMFALRLLEAQCIEVRLDVGAACRPGARPPKPGRAPSGAATEERGAP